MTKNIRLTGKYVNEVVEGMKYEGFIQFIEKNEEKRVHYVITLKKNLSEWTEDEMVLNSYRIAKRLADIQACSLQEVDVIKNDEFVKAVILSLSLPTVVYFYKEKKRNNDGPSTFFIYNTSTDRVTGVFREVLKKLLI